MIADGVLPGIISTSEGVRELLANLLRITIRHYYPRLRSQPMEAILYVFQCDAILVEGRKINIVRIARNEILSDGLEVNQVHGHDSHTSLPGSDNLANAPRPKQQLPGAYCHQGLCLIPDVVEEAVQVNQTVRVHEHLPSKVFVGCFSILQVDFEESSKRSGTSLVVCQEELEGLHILHANLVLCQHSPHENEGHNPEHPGSKQEHRP
mmetsp:Transcript_53564/g.127669  ORF Transcript_53564/g.127669 Transcript_53564/m.127669 type:complete len:208 (+) Transcript_53564:603-1226(+)